MLNISLSYILRKKFAKIKFFEVQQLVNGVEHIKGHFCTLFTPTVHNSA